jgi:hypothetical protein
LNLRCTTLFEKNAYCDFVFPATLLQSMYFRLLYSKVCIFGHFSCSILYSTYLSVVTLILRIKHLRTVQNMIVVFLAIFDLLICGYLLPFSMHILIWNQEPDKRICKFQAIITAFLFSCSIKLLSCSVQSSNA